MSDLTVLRKLKQMGFNDTHALLSSHESLESDLAKLQERVEELDEAIRRHKRTRESLDLNEGIAGLDLDYILWAKLKQAKAEEKS